MTTQGNVQAVNINDLKRYAPEARVNQPLLSSKDLVTRMNCYEPGQITPLHIHPSHDEVVFCVEGRGAVTFEERDDVPLLPGTVVSLPAGLAHRIEAAPDS
ncbi:MAG: cupin domain-containing protein, partial [Burkholderiales bacterium]